MSNSLPKIPEVESKVLVFDSKSELSVISDQDSVVKPEAVIATEDRNAVKKDLKNWNPAINAMASAQGIEVGSWDWMLGGIAPWSGSAGEHSSYGWRHTHKLSPKYIRSVLANYGHRRSFYLGAPFRRFNYEAAGRPHGWEPESLGDMPDGSTVYMTSNGPVEVTGPDAEHMWLTPLFALIDDPNPIEVETGMGNRLPSNIVAKWLATLIVSSAVGMVRDQNGDGIQPYPWTYGDRATSRLLHTIVEGMKRGCLFSDDIPTAAFFIRDIVLAFYEKAPGIHTFGAGRPGQFPMGLFNGLNWIMPACYDAANALRGIKGIESWSERFDKLLERWSQWMVDMNDALPGECFRADRLFIDNAFISGVNGESPSTSIAGFIKPEDFYFSFDFKPWAFRAVDIAATISGNKNLIHERDKIVTEYGSDQGKRQWIVGADGEYAV